MKLSMADVCKKCGGKCCQPPIFLSEFDIKKLKEIGKKFTTSPAGEAGYNLLSPTVCPFLKKGSGCTLTEDQKPIDCILYPLAFTEENDTLTFYLNGRCPLHKDVPKDWIKKTIKWAKLQLKHWTPAERRTYIKRQINDLISINL